MTLPSPNQIAVRAYTEKPGFESRNPSRSDIGPSPWSVTFDTETTTDPSQELRVGFYQVHDGERLDEEGAFYRAGSLSSAEVAMLRAYCAKHGLTLRDVDSFNEEILLGVCYDLGGTLIGFNLPFDISRVAIKHGPARDSMRGGFSFNVVKTERRPRIRVKHLSRTASLIDFAIPGVNETPRGMRKRGQRVQAHRGYFIDLKTVAAALTSRSHSLESLTDALGTVTRKSGSEEHGGPLTDSYLDYVRTDVQATWECYLALKTEYARHGLGRDLSRILSEASLGKAYLTQMGVQPLLVSQEIDRASFGPIMCAYYGGRAEVRIRRTITEVIYTDFKSMYPTVNTLMGLWRFVIAEGYQVSDGTADVRAFLASVTLDDLQHPDTWRRLPAICRVRPDEDLFPVRAKYDGQVNTIGLNHLSSEREVWYALSDVIAAKLLTGKAPEVLEACVFTPGPVQKGLKPIRLFGDDRYQIDPRKDDLFNRLIDLRDDAKERGDDRQLAIKILANSTSYGIFIEMQRDNAPKKETIRIAGPDGVFQNAESTALEQPGNYFHPLLGVTITAAARLMLALAEAQAKAQGLGWTFCDTDSLAIARPGDMERSAFRARAQAVIDWFEPLNPYAKPGSILQMEDVNFTGDGELEPLYAFAISAKRYALFNIDEDGAPIIRKASAHGLGHLMPPYGEDNPARGIPAPIVSLGKLGVRRWQYDLWHALLSAALQGAPDRVPLDYHRVLKKPATQRYGATSPALLKWMDHYNAGKPYTAQIRPFGFLVGFQTKPAIQCGLEEDLGAVPGKRGRPSKASAAKPVAAFERDPELAASRAFDRVTGETLGLEVMQTYAGALTRYHISPEWKFEHAGYAEHGETLRRRVNADSVMLIGKEANGVGGCGEKTDPASLKDLAINPQEEDFEH